MRTDVESYSGFTADERPLRFRRGAQWISVEKVLDRWRDPEAMYFRVRSSDGECIVLRHSEREDMWSVES